MSLVRYLVSQGRHGFTRIHLCQGVSTLRCAVRPICSRRLFAVCRHEGKAKPHFQCEFSFSVVKTFHTSPQRRIPPVLWLFVKPVAKLGAILSGRSARKWWQGLPDKKRAYLWSRLRAHWYLVVLGLASFCGVGLAYYRYHIEETPLTQRKRFIAVTHEQFMKISNAEAEAHQETFKDKLLPPRHPRFERVQRVCERLTRANPQVMQLGKFDNWTVHVVDDPSTINAFVLPTGQIFVFTGIMDFCNNDDQLAVILAHEMAHALLNHGIEQVSYVQIVDFFIITSMAAIWCLMPNDGVSLITQWFYNKFIQIMLHMPYSRMLEKEADKVGLQLAAKACYDVREGSVFWSRMGFNEEINARDEKIPEWLSTHPSHEKRVELFDFLVPKALELRAAAQCPMLPARDPRESIKILSAMVDDHNTAKKTGQNLSRVKVKTLPDVVTAAS